MNRTAKIIIGILVLVCGFFLLLAQIQASEAQKQAAAAMAAQMEARTNAERADAEAKRSEDLAAKAIIAQNHAEVVTEQLKKCRDSK